MIQNQSDSAPKITLRLDHLKAEGLTHLVLAGAIKSGDAETVKIFLDENVKPKVVKGQHPIATAIIKNHENVLSLLWEKSKKSFLNNQVFTSVINHGSPQLLQKMVEAEPASSFKKRIESDLNSLDMFPCSKQQMDYLNLIKHKIEDLDPMAFKRFSEKMLVKILAAEPSKETKEDWIERLFKTAVLARQSSDPYQKIRRAEIRASEEAHPQVVMGLQNHNHLPTIFEIFPEKSLLLELVRNKKYDLAEEWISVGIERDNREEGVVINALLTDLPREGIEWLINKKVSIYPTSVNETNKINSSIALALAFKTERYDIIDLLIQQTPLEVLKKEILDEYQKSEYQELLNKRHSQASVERLKVSMTTIERNILKRGLAANPKEHSANPKTIKTL